MKEKINFKKNNIVIQSMTNTKTKDINATLMQIENLKNVGCQLVRVAILDDEDMLSLKEIVKKSPLPIIADIHFNYLYAIKAIEAGVFKIRLNPGNIYKEEEVKQIIDIAKKKNVFIRIGVNSGSIPNKIVEKYGHTAKAMLKTLDDYLKIFIKYNFSKIIISLKASDPLLNIKVNEMAYKKYGYPIHLGITEAGPLVDAIIKSTIGLSPLLKKGIGNTIRISISDDPVIEVKVAYKILNSLKLMNNRVNIISCPTCGRLSYNMFELVNKIDKYCENIFFPFTISILGCVVNGIGEGKHADIGIAGSNTKAIIFEKGKVIKTINANDAYEEIIKLIDKYYKAYKDSTKF